MDIVLSGNRELPFGPMLRRSPSAEASMLGGDDRTDDPVTADKRNFYKVGLWTRDDRTERMLFAGTSLDEARAQCLPTTPGIALRRG